MREFGEKVLVISCCGKKVDTAVTGRVRAIDLYTSRQFKLARRLEELGWTVLILSAEHGMVHADTKLETYDREMDAARAAELIADPYNAGIFDIWADGCSEAVFFGGVLYRSVFDAITDALDVACTITHIEGMGSGDQYSALAGLVEDEEEAAGRSRELPFVPYTRADRGDAIAEWDAISGGKAGPSIYKVAAALFAPAVSRASIVVPPPVLAVEAGQGVPFRFYGGMHHPSDARHLTRACISLKRLRGRRSDFTPPADGWMGDSGAFTDLDDHGEFQVSVAEHAAEIRRWAGVGRMHAAVAQDWMCSPRVLSKTGLSIADHQRLTIERYDALMEEGVPVYVMPVLQGQTPADYARHAVAYGDRLKEGAWVGVGSIQRISGRPDTVADILMAILNARPGLRLHGFGLKLASLMHPTVRRSLATADSMAWSFIARQQGRDPNDWQEAVAFAKEVEAAGSRPATDLWQPMLEFGGLAAAA